MGIAHPECQCASLMVFLQICSVSRSISCRQVLGLYASFPVFFALQSLHGQSLHGGDVTRAWSAARDAYLNVTYVYVP